MGTEDEHLTIRDCFRSWSNCWKYLVHNRLLLANVVAVTLGLAMGLFLKNWMTLTPREKMLVSSPGDLLIRMLELVCTPLVTTSVLLGASALTAQLTRKIALCAAVYILTTTIICAFLGVVLVLLFKPGAGQTGHGQLEDEGTVSLFYPLFDLLRNLFPQNPIQACFQHYESKRLRFPPNATGSSLKRNATEMEMEGGYVDGVNTLGLILYSFVTGRILQGVGTRGQILVDFIDVINAANRFVVDIILCYLPFGVMFMIASSVLEVHDLETFYRLAKFMGVIVFGLVLHSVIILPAVYYLFVRRNPLTVVKGVFPALLSAWFISSSSAILPITLRYCVERNRIDRRVTRFMLPIATSINMDGTALYEAAAVVFVAQFNNIDLNLGQLVTIGVTSVVSSMGSSGLPAVGAVTTVFVLSSVGIPAKNAVILVTVEWLLDRCNTVVNVLGDCFGVSLINHLFREDLRDGAVQ
ncbi:excitatory amino acid transporter 3-like isoform 1-T1 [Spinachia spinachia]